MGYIDQVLSQQKAAEQPPAKPGFVKGVVQAVTKPFLRTTTSALNVAEATGSLLGGNKQAAAEALDKTRNFGYLGQNVKQYELKSGQGAVSQYLPTLRSAADVAGGGAEIASNFIGGSGAVKGAKQLAKGAFGSAVKTGVGQGALAGTLAGGGSAAQNENASFGSVAGSAVVGGLAGGAIGGALTGAPAAFQAVRAFKNPEVESTLIKAIKPRANNRDFRQALSTALPDISAVAQKQGKPIDSLEALSGAINRAKKIVWSEYEQVQNKAMFTGTRAAAFSPQGAAKIDGNKIADEIVSSINKRFRMQSPAAAERIEAIAQSYRRQIPISEAEDFLQAANNDLHSYYAKNKVSQRVAARDPDMGHVVKEADALRKILYSKLEELTGQNAGAIKQRYGALSNIEDELLRRINVAARQNPDSLAEQIGFARGAAQIAKSAMNLQLGDALEGATQMAGSRYLKNRNTSDELVKKAFGRTSRPAVRPGFHR
jgi:hypothetical protein